MSRISEMSILYGSVPVTLGPSKETFEPTVEDTLLASKDEELAVLVRVRGERAFFDGDEALAVMCRDLWRKLTVKA